MGNWSQKLTENKQGLGMITLPFKKNLTHSKSVCFGGFFSAPTQYRTYSANNLLQVGRRIRDERNACWYAILVSHPTPLAVEDDRFIKRRIQSSLQCREPHQESQLNKQKQINNNHCKTKQKQARHGEEIKFRLDFGHVTVGCRPVYIAYQGRQCRHV